MYGNIRVLSQHASPNSISVFGWKRTTSGFFVVTVFLCTCSRPPSTNLEEVKADWYSEFTANKYFDPNCRKVLLGSRFFLWGSESGIRLFVCQRWKIGPLTVRRLSGVGAARAARWHLQKVGIWSSFCADGVVQWQQEKEGKFDAMMKNYVFLQKVTFLWS